MLLGQRLLRSFLGDEVGHALEDDQLLEDVGGLLLHLADGLHGAVLHAQDSGGGLSADLLGIAAGQQLEAGGAEQGADSKLQFVFSKKPGISEKSLPESCAGRCIRCTINIV